MPWRKKMMAQDLRSLADRLEAWDSHLGEILDGLPIWFTIADDSRFLRTNIYGPQVMGYTRDELLAASYWDLIDEADVAKTVDILSSSPQIKEGAEGVKGFRNRYQHRDGSLVEWEWSSVQFPTFESGVVHFGQAIKVG